MKRRLTSMACLATLLIIAACGGEDKKQEAPTLSSLEPGLQQACYAMGVDLGRQVAGMPGADDFDQVAQGVRETLAGEPRLDFNVAREILSVQAHDHAEGEAEGEVHDHPDTWTERGFASETAQRSYAVGVTVGQFVQMQVNEPDVDALMQGVMDKVNDKELLIDEAEAGNIITAYQQEQAAQAAVENVAAGEKFLAENAKRPGVEVTESGLQYEVLQEGDGGAHPTAESTVKVHYHGTLIDGDVFDSSVERGEPISFPLNRVIPGWTEGVQLMTPGAKYKFFIPSDLAYGERGAGAKIGPNSTLVFEVELLEIQ